MQQQHCVMRDAGAGAGAHLPATSLSSTSSSPKPPRSLCKCYCSFHGGLTNTKLMKESWGLQPSHILISPPAWAYSVTTLSGSSAYGLGKTAPLSQAWVSGDPATRYCPASETSPNSSQKSKEVPTARAGPVWEVARQAPPCLHMLHLW